MNHLVTPKFPNSYFDPFLITSPYTPKYNCIAWAYEDNTRWYWPDPSNIYYWPPKVPRKVDVDSFISLFTTIGYECCSNGEFEDGFLKVAIFTDANNTPTHAARQLTNGFWTSKLGQNIDVQHSIKAMEEGEYGKVAIFMKRKIN